MNFIDPSGLKVTIVINDRKYSSTGKSVQGKINVTSDKTKAKFNGVTLENAHAGLHGKKNPVPAGTYSAMVNKYHTPYRIELTNVNGYTHIEIHNGNYPRQFKGCFGAGQSGGVDYINNSKEAVRKIDNIIKQDGSKNIVVRVGAIK